MNKTMVVSHEEIVRTRLELTKQMNDYILNTKDEILIEMWQIGGIPDCPDEEDFEYYANDETEFRALCEFFGRLVRYE